MAADPAGSQSSSNQLELDPRRIQDGCSLVEAILSKYVGSMASGLHDMGDVQVYCSAPARKMQKLSDVRSNDETLLRLPSIVGLQRCGIYWAGERERISELCGNVQELDLAENALKSWTEILTILSGMQNLEFLNLSSNPLNEAPPLVTSITQVTMETVRRLVLNNTKLQWETVHSLLKIMPRLDELHLSLNEFTSVTTSSPEAYSHLKLLQFNSNKIESWREIQKLGVMFPELETLILMGNPLRKVAEYEPLIAFAKLQMLCLSETLLGSWEDLERLNGYPSLTELLLQGVPLVDGLHGDEAKKKARQMVIARLGKLTRLNRSRVTETERKESERLFIREFRDKEVKPPRYEELVQKHGELQDLAKVNLPVRKIFKCHILFEGQKYDIDVHIKSKVFEFMKQIGSIIGVRKSQFRVFYMPAAPERILDSNKEMKWPTRLLMNYHVTDGDCFDVLPKFV